MLENYIMGQLEIVEISFKFQHYHAHATIQVATAVSLIHSNAIIIIMTSYG